MRYCDRSPMPSARFRDASVDLCWCHSARCVGCHLLVWLRVALSWSSSA